MLDHLRSGIFHQEALAKRKVSPAVESGLGLLLIDWFLDKGIFCLLTLALLSVNGSRWQFSTD